MKRTSSLYKILAFGILSTFLLSCTNQVEESNKAIINSVENYIYDNHLNCIPIRTPQDYSRLVISGYIEIKNQEYMINSNIRGTSYIRRYSDKGIYNQIGDIYGICSPVHIIINSIEDKPSENYKYIYWNANISDTELFKGLSRNNLPELDSIFTSDNVALFSKFDNVYKLKANNNFLLSISDTIKFYNEDATSNKVTNNSNKEFTDNFLLTLIKGCSNKNVSPITMEELINQNTNGEPFVIKDLLNNKVYHDATYDEAVLRLSKLKKTRIGITQIKSTNEIALLDPCTNIHLGSKILQEYYHYYITKATIKNEDAQQIALRKALDSYSSGLLIKSHAVKTQQIVTTNISQNLKDTPSYSDQVLSMIAKHRESLPHIYLDPKLKVILKVVLNTNLSVKSVTVIKSSGSDYFDKYMENVILQINRFPQLPNGANFSDFRILNITARP